MYAIFLFDVMKTDKTKKGKDHSLTDRPEIYDYDITLVITHLIATSFSAMHEKWIRDGKIN